MAAAKKQETNVEEVQTAERKFGKEQIVSSTRYRNHKDLVDALLEDKKKYTFREVDSMIEKYKKGKVE